MNVKWVSDKQIEFRNNRGDIEAIAHTPEAAEEHIKSQGHTLESVKASLTPQKVEPNPLNPLKEIVVDADNDKTHANVARAAKRKSKAH